MSDDPQYHRDVYLPLANIQEEVYIDTAAQHAIMALRHLSTDDAFHAIRGIVRDWIANAYIEGDGGARGRIARAVLRTEDVLVAVKAKQERARVVEIEHEAAKKGHLHVSGSWQ